MKYKPVKKYYIVSKTLIGIRHCTRIIDETYASLARNVLGEDNIILFATEEELTAVRECMSS